MKKVILSYINGGATENSRLLRLVTTALTMVFGVSVALYWVYYFLVVKQDSFVFHPKSIFDFVSDGIPDVLSFIYYSVLSNYLVTLLFLFIIIVCCFFKLYQTENIRKINKKESPIGLLVVFSGVVALFLGIKAVESGEYVESFYGFLVFSISFVFTYFAAISFAFLDIKEVGDFMRFLGKIYIKHTSTKILLVAYTISFVFSLYEPSVLIATFYILFATLISVAFSLMDTPLSDTQDGRVNKMKLRGFSIPEGDTQYDIYLFSLNELLKAKKKGHTKRFPVYLNEEEYDINIDVFSKTLENVYSKNHIDEDEVVFICIKGYQSSELNSDEFCVKLIVHIYNLENEILSDTVIETTVSN